MSKKFKKSFNSFWLFHIFCLFHCFLALLRETSAQTSVIGIVYFELNNGLDIVGNIYWQTCLKGRLLFPTNYICRS